MQYGLTLDHIPQEILYSDPTLILLHILNLEYSNGLYFLDICPDVPPQSWLQLLARHRGRGYSGHPSGNPHGIEEIYSILMHNHGDNNKYSHY